MPRSQEKREVKSAVPDPVALKALAHPMRLRMLGLLRVDGPATATQLAKRLGLNSGATSYHLRQLARHEFIEAADDLGDQRDRWWRAAHESTRYDTTAQAGDDFEAGMAMTQAVLSGHAQQMQRAHDAHRTLPVEWRRASTASDYILALTAEQGEGLTKRIEALLQEAMAASPPLGQATPEGARPFTVILHAFPHPGFGEKDKDQ